MDRRQRVCLQPDAVRLQLNLKGLGNLVTELSAGKDNDARRAA